VFLLFQGLVHGAVGHGLLGLSLWLTVLAVFPAAPSLAEAYPADLGANAISYVGGFVIVVAPGGLGVREVLLATALTGQFKPALGPEEAAALGIVVALLLRFVWTVAEVVVAVPLYLVRPTAAPIPHHTHHPELLDQPAPEAPPHAP
jgi:hypothetical protein